MTPPLRFATICTPRYRPQLDRLLFSIAKTHPGVVVDVFTNDPAEFPGVESPTVRLRALPQIDELGVKRAKFWMYREAIAEGPFVYLDADVVVLDDLRELLASPGLTACNDDLRGCPFVVDRTHPWPRDPELVNAVYVNSGVLGFGEHCGRLLDDALALIADDEFWFSHIHPGGLFDNHVLCALLNLQKWPLRLVSEFVYNWRGFRDPDRTIAAQVIDGNLVHRLTGERLRLIHFAGIVDIDDYLVDVPFEVARTINVASVTPTSPARAVAAVVASIDATRLVEDPDPHRLITAEVLARGFADSWSDIRRDRLPSTYVADPDVMTSVALALPPRPSRWNGLTCGGAYLEAGEYSFLRDLARAVPPGTIVETGAGETSILFSRERRTVSIEAFEGPWLERAKASAAEAHRVDFSLVTGFDETALDRIIAAAGDVALLFIDSPSGAPNRRLALRQIVERCTPRCIAIHDSRRDLHALLAELAGGGFVIDQVLDSFRGLVVLRRLDASPLAMPVRAREDLPADLRAGIRIHDAEAQVEMGGSTSINVSVANASPHAWPSAGAFPVRLSYHLHQSGAVVQFDGARTDLPCPIDPGDTLECAMTIDATLLAAGDYGVHAALVQEGVRWIDAPDQSATLPLIVSPLPPSPMHALRERRRPEPELASTENRVERRLRASATERTDPPARPRSA